MATLSDYVDIGGECFNITGTMVAPPATQINTTKTYDLVCKSKTQFEKTFKEILNKFPDTIRLFSIYLPYQKEQLLGITDNDKVTLRAIIEARLTSLQESSQHSNNSIKNMQFVRYIDNLKKLLEDIDNVRSNTSIIPESVVQKRVRDGFKKERVYYVLMELAWYLLHPDSIKTNSNQWMKLLDAVDTLKLGEMIKLAHDPTKDDMTIDINHVESKNEFNKDIISPPDASAELKKRLESILQLFVMRKYLKAPFRGNAKGPLVNEKTINELSGKLPEPMMSTAGGGNNAKSATNNKNANNVNSFKISSESVAKMMKPFYDFFREKYDPITSVLSGDASKQLPDGLSLVSLSKLLFICQKIISQSPIQHGIYRITNIDPAIMEFLRTQLGSVQAYVNDESRSDEERKSFTDEAGLVPVVSIKSLLNKFGKSGHYTDPETIPIVRIMIMGINLESSKEEMEFDKDAHKMDFDNAVHDFFEEQAIYLVCNEAASTQTPMNVAEVDYQSVNVSKNTWELNELKDHYFNEVRKPELFLEDVMDVKSNIVYNHGMLALSMFIASEELLPK